MAALMAEKKAVERDLKKVVMMAEKTVVLRVAKRVVKKAALMVDL